MRTLVWMHPNVIARNYSKVLYNAIVEDWYDQIASAVFPQLNTMIVETRFDSTLSRAIDTVKYFMKFNMDISVSVLARRYAKELDKFNHGQAIKVMQSEVFIPYIDKVIENFVEQNVRLVQGLSDEMARLLEQRIISGVKKGYNASQLQKSIMYRFGIEKGVFQTIKTRMELIAVDQIGKLNADLTELRQTLLGVDEYIWRTRRDNKVRKEDAEREGKTYRWGPTVAPFDAPGRKVRCRCWAEPILTSILKKKSRYK